MRIEFVYGPFSCGFKEYNFERLFEDPQGLTGSESSCFCLAREMVKRGHEVTLYTSLPHYLPHPYDFDGVQIRRLGLFYTARVPPQVVLSYNEPDILKYVNPRCLRMVNQQLNDFGYCNEQHWDQFVDIFTSPSASHLKFISKFLSESKHKWKVLPNGYDTEMFDTKAARDPGTVIYASSPDRGLHLLLQEWPKIKNAVPCASLKVFYSFDHWFNMANSLPPDADPNLKESGNRAKYAYYALDKMRNGYSIKHYKSVSKYQLAREMSKSMVLAYPCSSVRATEGFSVTTLEACASGMVPVISSQDSLGEIYGGCVPMIDIPARKHIEQFTEYVIRGLTDKQFFEETTAKTKEFAKQFTWKKIAERLEQMMMLGLEEKCNVK